MSFGGVMQAMGLYSAPADTPATDLDSVLSRARDARQRRDAQGQSATKIQAVVRGRQERQTFIEQKNAAVTIQATTRGFSQRRAAAAPPKERVSSPGERVKTRPKPERSAQQRRSASSRSAQAARQASAPSSAATPSAARKPDNYLRSNGTTARHSRDRSEKGDAAASLLQSSFRGSQARTDLRKSRDAATTIQSQFRGHAEREKVRTLKREKEESVREPRGAAKPRVRSPGSGGASSAKAGQVDSMRRLSQIPRKNNAVEQRVINVAVRDCSEIDGKEVDEILTMKQMTFRVSNLAKVLDIKVMVEQETGIYPANQRMVFKGTVLTDAATLVDSEVTEDNTVLHMFRLEAGGGGQAGRLAGGAQSLSPGGQARRGEGDKGMASPPGFDSNEAAAVAADSELEYDGGEQDAPPPGMLLQAPKAEQHQTDTPRSKSKPKMPAVSPAGAVRRRQAAATATATARAGGGAPTPVLPPHRKKKAPAVSVPQTDVMSGGKSSTPVSPTGSTVRSPLAASTSIMPPDTPRTGDPARLQPVTSSMPASTRVLGIGLRSAVIHKTASYTIVAKDAAGRHLTSGGDRFTAVIRGPSQGRTTVKDRNDGTYVASYIITTSGDYQVDVKMSGVPIPGSPFRLCADPAPPPSMHVPNCVLAGGGLSTSMSGKKSTFTIRTKDTLGRTLLTYGDHFEAVLESKSFHAARLAADAGDAAFVGSGLDDSGRSVVRCDVTDNADSTYTVTYMPRIKGRHVLSVTHVAEEGGVHMPGSPFPINVTAGMPDPLLCEVQHGGISVGMDSSNGAATGPGMSGIGVFAIPAGEPGELKVICRDTFGNCRLAGGDEALFNVALSDVVLSGTGNNAGTMVMQGASSVVASAVSRSSIGGRQGSVGRNKNAGSPERKAAVVAANAAHGSSSPSAAAAAIPAFKRLVDHRDGSYTTTYCLRRAGSYTVSVTLSGQAVKYAPFKLKVHPGLSSAAVSRVSSSSPVPKAAEACITHSFVIEATDKWGNQCIEGGDKVQAFIEGASQTVDCVVADNQDGTYRASFSCTDSGSYQMHVLLNDAALHSSPYPLDVVAGAIDANSCWSDGAGLSHSIAGMVAEFKVQARDAAGNTLGRGGGDVRAVLLDPSKRCKVSEEEQVALLDHEDGSYSASYCVQTSGDFLIAITVGGKAIPGSPFSTQVQPGSADGGSSFVKQAPANPASPGVTPAPAVSRCVAGVEASFDIQAADRFGNIRRIGGDGCSIDIRPFNRLPGGDGAAPGGSTPTDGDLVVDEGEDGSGGRVDALVQDCKNGVYKVSYTIAKAGRYQIVASVGGSPIPGSPFTLTCAAGAISAENASVSGKGLSSAVTKSVASFTITTYDAFLNRINRGGHKFQFVVKGPTTVRPQVKDNSDGTYSVEYTPTVTGTYSLNILTAKVTRSGNAGDGAVKGMPAASNSACVAGSPFSIVVHSGEANFRPPAKSQVSTRRPGDVLRTEHPARKAAAQPAGPLKASTASAGRPVGPVGGANGDTDTARILRERQEQSRLAREQVNQKKAQTAMREKQRQTAKENKAATRIQSMQRQRNASAEVDGLRRAKEDERVAAEADAQAQVERRHEQALAQAKAASVSSKKKGGSWFRAKK